MCFLEIDIVFCKCEYVKGYVYVLENVIREIFYWRLLEYSKIKLEINRKKNFRNFINI